MISSQQGQLPASYLLIFHRSNTLGNERHRKLYNALTGTEIEKEPFWPQFKRPQKSATR